MASKTVTRSINPAIVFFCDVKRHKKRATSDDKIKQPSTIGTFDYIIIYYFTVLIAISHLFFRVIFKIIRIFNFCFFILSVFFHFCCRHRLFRRITVRAFVGFIRILFVVRLIEVVRILTRVIRNVCLIDI